MKSKYYLVDYSVIIQLSFIDDRTCKVNINLDLEANMENEKEKIATLIISSPFWVGTKDVAELCKKTIGELQRTLTSLEIREEIHTDTLYGN